MERNRTVRVIKKILERVKQIKSIDFKAKFGFSLMEMMIVLLIVAIIAAATAPVVSKKMTKNMGTNDSPWIFTNTNGTVAYNPSGNANATAIIGAASVPAGVNTRLFIDCGDANHSHIAFGRGNSTPMQITADPQNRRVGISNANISNDSVALGTRQTIGANSITIGDSASTGIASIAIGTAAIANNMSSIAIGSALENRPAEARGEFSISMGSDSSATGDCSISLGQNTFATGGGSVSIGVNSIASSNNSIAIGNGANATGNDSVAIGHNAVADHNKQITLGSDTSTVYIPGTLIVGKKSYLGTDINERSIWGKFNANEHGFLYDGGSANRTKFDGSNYTTAGLLSDRRLKNVGEKYTAGLEELKKLEFFHYTFKKDKDKTPHVGVMAQDLQEVFPDAVTLGHDGYLRIRMEDMFYAVINAVKELDLKLSEVVESVKNTIEELGGLDMRIETQQKTIEAQQTAIEELKAQNAKQQSIIESQQKLIKSMDERLKKVEKRKV